jgi:CheY-like chemotaxis protein
MSTSAAKVLVVDDERPIRKLLRMGLTAQGYEILEAPDGRTSLELLAQKPDLVILDLGLPDIQGLDLLRMIRARDESLPFGDQKLYRVLIEELKFDYLIRFRGNIAVTSAEGETRAAEAWVGSGGRPAPCGMPLSRLSAIRSVPLYASMPKT